MKRTNVCEDCGAELPTGTTEGLCPRCLLGAAAGLCSAGVSLFAVDGQRRFGIARFRRAAELRAPALSAAGIFSAILVAESNRTYRVETSTDLAAYILLAVQPDGKILVGGRGVGPNFSGLARLNVDGGFDTGFKLDNQIRTDSSDGQIFRVALQPDGQILIAGAFARVNGASAPNLARLKSDGSLAVAFDPWKNRDPTPLFTRQPDGRLRVLAWRGENSYEFVVVSEDGQFVSGTV